MSENSNSDCDTTLPPTPTSGCDTTGSGGDTAGPCYMSPLPCGGHSGASPNPCVGGAASPGVSPTVGESIFVIKTASSLRLCDSWWFRFIVSQCNALGIYKCMSGRLRESGSLFCECALNLIFSVQEFISKARQKESRKM